VRAIDDAIARRVVRLTMRGVCSECAAVVLSDSARNGCAGPAHNVHDLRCNARVEIEKGPIQGGGRLMRVVKALCCAAALVVCVAPGARADEFNKKTILTFSGPVQIPGATLAQGTYVFKLADLQGNRHVVQVFDKDEKKIYGTILAIPDQKLEPSDKPVVLFAERPAGTPQAIRAWFYPGETIGNEFVYPKSQAMRIAKETHQSVLAMDEDTKSATDEERMKSMKSASVSRVDENGKTASTANDQSNARSTGASAAATTTDQSAPQNKPATTTATSAGAPAASTTASNDARLKNGSGRDARTRNNTAMNNAPKSDTSNAVGTSGQNNTANRNGRRSLPRTASNLSLFEALSGLFLMSALGVRYARTRVAECH